MTGQTCAHPAWQTIAELALWVVGGSFLFATLAWVVIVVYIMRRDR